MLMMCMRRKIEGFDLEHLIPPVIPYDLVLLPTLL